MQQALGPRSQHVYQALRRGIVNGEFPAGSRLPAHTTLGTQFHVATMTARQAILALEREGLVQSQQGRGTVVCRMDGDVENTASRQGLTENGDTQFGLGPLVGVAQVSLGGRVLSANRALENILGYTENELRRMAFPEFTYPDDLEADLALAKELFAGVRDHYQMEKRYIRKDGQVIWARLYARSIRDERDRPQSAVAMVEDITARRRIEETLLNSQEQLREQRDFLGVITSNIAEGVYVIDRDGQMLFMNPAAEQMLGWTQVELLGRKAHDIIHVVPPGGGTPDVSKVYSTMNAVFRRKDETTLPVSFTSSPIVKHELVTGAVLSFLDRSEHTQAEDSLRESEARFRALFNRAPIGIELVDRNGRFMTTNPAFGAMLGYSDDELHGQHFAVVSHPDDVQAELELDAQLDRRERQSYALEKRFIRKDGEIIWGQLSVSDVGWLDDDSYQFTIGTVVDVTERVRAEQALREREERYRSVVEASLDAIFINDLDGTIIFANQQAAAMLGFGSSDELVGRRHVDFIASEDHPGLMAGLESLMENAVETVYLRGLRRDGTSFPTEIRGSLMIDDSGAPVGFTAVVRDITEQQAYQDQLRHQALHDALLGLPNRTLFQNRLDDALDACNKDGGHFAILLLDLDRFKEINDALGHQLGDLLLSQVGKRLQRTVRDSDTVARFGGDEFALLLPNAGKADALQMADKILTALDEAFVVDEHTFHIGASVGVVLAPDQGSDPSTLIRCADVAMYTAKRNESRYALYEVGADRHTKERLELVSQLRHSIEEGQLVLHYQPKVNLRTGCAEHVEALVRWAHPKHGFIPPDQFIELAEQTGLIRSLGIWVLNDALRQVAVWHAAGLDIAVAVNLSPRNLQDRDLVATIARFLKRWGVKPSSLGIEITESAIMSNPDLAMATVTTLHQMGIKIAIDDFGIGYSSLAYLKRLPVDEIKIDRSFVQDIQDNDPESLFIVHSVIELGHNLGLQIVAEGVETQVALDMLSEMGCDLAQGYHLSRPLDAVACRAWLEEPTASGLHRLSQ